MDKYKNHLTNIFKIENSEIDSGPDPFDELCWGDAELRGITGIDILAGVSGVSEIFFISQGKYIQGEIHDLFTKDMYKGESKETEGIYKDYIVGILYKKELIINVLERYEKGEKIERQEKVEELFIKVGDLDISLGRVDSKREQRPQIDIEKLPMKVKITQTVRDGILHVSLDKVNKIKDSVSELVREILEENGEKPTEKEIEEIVKGFKFDK